MGGASRLVPLPSFLALALAGAHFWRAGWPSLAAGCGLMAVLVWTRLAWVRQFLLLALPVLAARWIWTTAQFVQIRQLMEQPWLRLAVILLSVALFTVAAALLLLRDSARQRYSHKEDAATAQMGAMAVCLALLLPVWFMKPQLLVLERFVPQGGLAQIMLAALWAVLAAGWLADRRKAPRARMRLWRLFSLVFFGQLVLGLGWKAAFCSRAVCICRCLASLRPARSIAGAAGSCWAFSACPPCLWARRGAASSATSACGTPRPRTRQKIPLPLPGCPACAWPLWP